MITKFTAKIRKLGNSWGIIIPRQVSKNLEVGKEYEWELIESPKNKISELKELVKEKPLEDDIEVIETKEWQ